MKAINNIKDRKLVSDICNKLSDDERVYVYRLIDTFNDVWNSSNKRSIEAIYDIILTNPGQDAFELFMKYKQLSSAQEKIKIRHGNESWNKTRNKYIERNLKCKNRVSHFTTSYWVNKGYTLDESVKKVSEIQSNLSKKRHNKAKKNPIVYRNIPHCVEYWINHGYSLEEAIAHKTEFNQKHSRSYENMIKKYGVELGIKNLKDANAKRKKTLLERYCVTTFGNNTSKASMKFFVPLYKKIRKLGISKDDVYWGITGSKEFATHFNGKNYFYDFTIKSLKIAIEFNGLYWHAREDCEWRRRDITKEQSLEYDNTKKSILQERGFNVYYIWEDYNMEQSLNEIFEIIKKEYDTTRATFFS